MLPNREEHSGHVESALQGPLHGRQIVVTRAAEQADELREELELLGAQVLLLPLIRFLEPTDSSELDHALANLTEFDWIIFTSANAAKFFARRDVFLKSAAGRHATKLPRVAAVGQATALAAASVGLLADFIAAGRSGMDLAEELAPLMKGARVLLPRSHRAGHDLPSALREAGAKVTEVVAYRTERADVARSPILANIVAGNVDAVLLASPSAFYALCDALDGVENNAGSATYTDVRNGEGCNSRASERLSENLDRTALAAIGATTAAAIRGVGLTIAVEAEEPSARGLAQAICRHFSAFQSQRTQA
jgi:uroporphyrinogen-III synthase